MKKHWHGVTVQPPNPLGIAQPEVTPATDWDRARAKREMQPIIRLGQGRLRYQDPAGRTWEPADWWLAHDPLQYVPLAEGAAMAAIMPCTGDCVKTAVAFIQDWAESLREAGMPNIETQTSVDDVAGLVSCIVPHAVPGNRYPQALPPELARWYVYPPECGHSIVVIPASELPTGGPVPSADLAELAVPVPVRTVQRLGYMNMAGFLVCPVEYDRELGVIVPDEDQEW